MSWILFDKEPFSRPDYRIPEEAKAFTVIGGGTPLVIYAWLERKVLQWLIWTPHGYIILSPKELLLPNRYDDTSWEFDSLFEVLKFIREKLEIEEEC